MTHYTQKDREQFEEILSRQQAIDNLVAQQDAPESELASKIRKHCKDNGLPCLIFPQTKAVRNFLPPGWPDVEIILKGRPLYLELKKVKGGRKSPAQKEMALRFTHLGFPIHECKTYKRFIEIIYGG